MQAETLKGIALDFELTQEQTMILDTVRKAVKGQLDRARIRELDDREEFPEDVWRSLAEMGVLASTIPEEYGGMGAPYITNVLILEELARAFSPLGLGFLVFSLLTPTIIQHAASEDLKREILPQVAERGMKIAFAITEPQGGTDILAMRMRAELKGGQYVLNGQKLFITGAEIAEKILTIARTGQNKERKSDGLTMFMVDRNAPGVEIRRLKKLGGKSLSVTEVFYKDVAVPASQVVGTPGGAWRDLLPCLNDERIATATVSLGIAHGAFAEAREYALAREAFGRPIGQFQAIQHYLADMAIKIEAARLLIYKAAWLRTNGLPCDLEAHIAKVFSTEAASEVATRGMDILAGHGFVADYDAQRHFRDARQYTFGPISNEMARNYIAQKLGMPRSY